MFFGSQHVYVPSDSDTEIDYYPSKEREPERKRWRRHTSKCSPEKKRCSRRESSIGDSDSSYFRGSTSSAPSSSISSSTSSTTSSSSEESRRRRRRRRRDRRRVRQERDRRCQDDWEQRRSRKTAALSSTNYVDVSSIDTLNDVEIPRQLTESNASASSGTQDEPRVKRRKRRNRGEGTPSRRRKRSDGERESEESVRRSVKRHITTTRRNRGTRGETASIQLLAPSVAPSVSPLEKQACLPVQPPKKRRHRKASENAARAAREAQEAAASCPSRDVPPVAEPSEANQEKRKQRSPRATKRKRRRSQSSASSESHQKKKAGGGKRRTATASLKRINAVADQVFARYSDFVRFSPRDGECINSIVINIASGSCKIFGVSDPKDWDEVVMIAGRGGLQTQQLFVLFASDCDFEKLNKTDCKQLLLLLHPDKNDANVREACSVLFNKFHMWYRNKN